LDGPISLGDLRAFCATCAEGSFSAAAKALGVQPKAVSSKLHDLENRLSLELFTVTERGAVPTDAARDLLDHARSTVAQADAVSRIAARITSRAIRVAVSHTIAEIVMPPALVEYEARKADHLAVNLLISNSMDVHQLVESGMAEFGIAALDPDEPAGRFEEFVRDEIVVAVPATVKLALRDPPIIELHEVAQIEMVMRDPDSNTRRVLGAALCAARLPPPRARIEAGSTHAIMAAALDQKIPALLSRASVVNDARFVALTIAGGVASRTFVVRIPSEHAVLRRSAAELLEHLRASADRIMGSSGQPADRPALS
jgi:DNA-binding transcriptional LysR family regulator